MSAPRVIAFYLPQFHPIPENDLWWGKGFTEWTNVAKARPLFPGHYQPHLPADLGFYDLRLREVRVGQAELARAHGIDGFCYYHYWFNGRRILERPFNEVLAAGEPDFPFCLCWANENWTRTWDGLEREVLLKQSYSAADDLNHIHWLAEAFSDPRYIRVGGRPLFIVYRSGHLPDARQTTDRWRQECARLGVANPFLVRVETMSDRLDPLALGFDAALSFQPEWGNLGKPLHRQPWTNNGWIHFLNRLKGDRQNVFEYGDLADRMEARVSAYRCFQCVAPGWDNTARRGRAATILVGSTPERFRRWMTHALQKEAEEESDGLVFINAWNEWAEGCHLEPDLRYGCRYLEATSDAVSEFHKP